MIGVYKDSKTPIEFFHRTCGHTFFSKLNLLLERGCPECSRKAMAFKKERAYAEVLTRLAPQFEAQGYRFADVSYRGMSKVSTFVCMNCGKSLRLFPSEVLKGYIHTCKKPPRVPIRKSHERFVSEVRELTGDEYTVLGKYISATDKIKLRHNACMREYYVLPAHFTSTGRRCPYCAIGEKFSDALDMNAEKIKKRIEQTERIYSSMDDDELRSKKHKEIVWIKNFERAVKYYEEYGNIDIPYGYEIDGVNMGSWIQEQRKAKRLGRLPDERKELLEGLSISWTPKDEHWDSRYCEYKEYLEHNGKPPSIRSNDGRSLAYWYCDQLQLYRDDRLDMRKMRLLESIGADKTPYTDDHFNKMVEKLVRFKEKNGHCIVPINEEKGEKDPLGCWAQKMRIALKYSRLSDDRANILRQIGLPESNRAARKSLK